MVPFHSTAEYRILLTRSSHLHLLDSELIKSCRLVTGCLKPTHVEDLDLLSQIAPPDIRRNVYVRVERNIQIRKEIHSLFPYIPATTRLKSRRCLLTSVHPVQFPPTVVRRNAGYKSHDGITTIHEDLAKGHENPRLTWS